MPAARLPLLPTVLIAGVAGALLIALYLIAPKAGVFGAVSPRILFQWDASNALGPAAFQGGWPVAALGFGMHLCVSIAWAALFAAAATRLPGVLRHPVPSGLFFGVVVFCVMSFGLVPLGAARPSSRSAAGVLNNLIAHTVFFGLPIAILSSRRLRAFSPR